MFGKEIGNVSIKVNEARDRATALKALGESLHDAGEVSRMVQPLDSRLFPLNKKDKSESNIKHERQQMDKHLRAPHSIGAP